MKYGRFIRAAGGWEALQRLLRALAGVAERHGVSIANVASRYILEQPAVAGVIIGARLGQSDHVDDNRRLFAFTLTAQDHDEITRRRATLTRDPRRLRRRVPAAAVPHRVGRPEPSSRRAPRRPTRSSERGRAPALRERNDVGDDLRLFARGAHRQSRVGLRDDCDPRRPAHRRQATPRRRRTS